MQAPVAVPTKRICQYVDPSTGKHCEAVLTGRGPRRWCKDHRQKVRRIQNATNKQTWEERHNDESSLLKWWYVVTSRLRRGQETTAQALDRLFAFVLRTRYSLPFNLFSSLSVDFEVLPAVLDFHVHTLDGPILFTWTFFGPNSIGRKVIGFTDMIEFKEFGELYSQMHLPHFVWGAEEDEHKLIVLATHCSHGFVSGSVPADSNDHDKIEEAYYRFRAAFWKEPCASLRQLAGDGPEQSLRRRFAQDVEDARWIFEHLDSNAKETRDQLLKKSVWVPPSAYPRKPLVRKTREAR